MKSNYKEKDIYWNFPENQSGAISGLGEAGIETFNGSPLESLAREICQNSLDAHKNISKPVQVEFYLEKIPTNLLPGIKSLRAIMENCLKFGTKTKDQKTIQFFKKAIKELNSKQISVLRISDFNTTGLIGSKEYYGTPWTNLVKASGISNKEGNAGGSFGIGKSAPFACSYLRTVFYSTYDQDNIEATQGVSRLISYPIDNEGGFSSGTGFYGLGSKSRPINGLVQLSLDFKREKRTGTDVYIIGFLDEEDWIEEIITSIIDNFLLSIYENKLEVKVQNKNINKDSLPMLINKYKNTPGFAYNYYQVITSSDNNYENIPFEDLGSIDLYILFDNDLHRKVQMNRSNGMKIFDNKNYKAGLKFAGVCILRGDEINAFFREMENPQHNNWEEKRHENKKKALQLKRKLNKVIREKVIEYGMSSTSEEMDAVGISDILPDIIPKEENKKKRKETISDDIDVAFSKINKPKKVTSYLNDTKNHSESNVLEIEGQITGKNYGDIGTQDFHDRTSHLDKGRDKLFGGEEGIEAGKNGTGVNSFNIGNLDFDNHFKVRSEIQNGKFKVRLIDNRQVLKDSYRIILQTNIDLVNAYILIEHSGEIEKKKDSQKLHIEKAVNKNHEEDLKINQNKIYLGSLSKDRKYMIDFLIDYKEQCSMKVRLYGSKI